MKENNLLHGILSYSISTWVNLIVGFLSVLITTRLLLPDVYGQVTMFYSVTTVMMYIITLGMDGAFIRFYNEPPSGDSKNQMLYKNIVISSVFCFIFAIFSIWFGGTYLSEKVFGISSRLVIGMVFTYSFCQIILRYLNISFRMSFRTTKYNIQNIFITCAYRVLVIIAAFITTNFVFIVTILTIGILVLLFIYLYLQRKEFEPVGISGQVNYSLSLRNYTPYFRFAFFSAPTYIVTYLNLYMAQQIIISKMSAYALGIFASTGAFNQILTAVKGGFSTYWSAYVYKNYKTEKAKISRMHDYVLFFSIFIASFMVLSRDLLYIVIGKNFHESKLFFSLLLLTPLFFFILETTEKGIALKNKNEIQFFSHFFSVVLNLVLSYIFIGLLGLKGVALANAISGIALYALCSYFGQKYYKTINSLSKSIIGTFFVVYILLIPLFVYDISILFLFVIPVDILSFFIYKEEVVSVYNIVSNYIKH